jgi:hypothetical protein
MERNFSSSFTVKQSAHEVFGAVNNVKAWWITSAAGNFTKVNDAFEVRFGDIHYSKQRLVEVIPDRRVVWLITDSRLNFTRNPEEWTGTKIVFDIESADGETTLRFTHEGLTPTIECYGACSGAWSQYVDSLQQLITTGKGAPHQE